MTTETYRDLPGMPAGWRDKQIKDKANVPFRSDFGVVVDSICRPGPAMQWLASVNLAPAIERERQFQAAYDASTPDSERTCFECGDWLDDSYNCAACAAMED